MFFCYINPFYAYTTNDNKERVYFIKLPKKCARLKAIHLGNKDKIKSTVLIFNGLRGFCNLALSITCGQTKISKRVPAAAC